MLGKLFKYEFKSTARWMLPSYVFLLAMSVINMGLVAQYESGIVIMTSPASPVFEVLETLLMMVYIISIVAVGMLTLFVAVTRFYKNLLSNEGYISLTLPVSIDEHLSVKLVTALVWILSTTLVLVLSWCILLAPTGIFSDLKYLPAAYQYMNFYLNGRLPVYIANLVFNGLFGAIQGILLLYFAMALGQLSNNHKVGMAIVAYIGINFAMQIISSILVGNMLSSTIMWAYDGIAVAERMSQYGFISMVISILLSIGFYLGTRYILTKKINLQ